MKKLTKEEFILKGKKVHNDTYDYSKTIYINCMEKVVIICPVHGEFEQTPLNHIQGNICKKCSSKLVSFNQRKNNEFIEKSNMKYNFKFDYSKVDYINRNTKVVIICPVHGEFMETPVNHLNRNGCNQCSKIDRLKLNKNKFIEQSKIIHNNKYDYSEVDYISDKIKVNIICEKHGIFNQQPNTHVNGSGCPKCSSSKGELRIQDYLLNNDIIFNREYKFDDCLYKKCLPFDFYLKEKNMCIEFDGKQHSRSIDFFGGDDTLKLTKIKDNIKNKYCLDNNIKILRISYKDYNKIEKILSQELWENY